LGAVQIDEKYDIWQVGCLQYARKNSQSFQLWDEVNDWFFEDAISVRYLHELLLQYYGLTFKHLAK
jgi:hypothetical protein